MEETVMGLMDVLTGMMNGPRGQPSPSAPSRGMSPLTMGLLALLAYKAMKGGGMFGSGAPSQQPYAPAGGASAGSGDWMSQLGSMIGGGAAGGLLSGGLGELVKRFQQNGQGAAAQSWVSTGANQDIAPQDLERAVGADTLDALAQQSGMSREELAARLARELPTSIDTVTPHGRMPTAAEADRWV
jgi:uncharacterized protein YidB (DUF937 family)